MLMKKILTLLSLLLGMVGAYAQDYVFTDKNGNAFEDGATVVRSDVEDDGFGGIQVPGGIWVMNKSDNSMRDIAIVAEISQMDNGSLQLCFPVNCQTYTAVGTHETPEKAKMTVGAMTNLLTEWMPTAYGTCVVTYQIKAYQSLSSEVVRTLTVKYQYVDPASGDNQKWWSYVDVNTNQNSVGTSTAENYFCAIFIPGNHAVVAGKTIKGVRFGLKATHASNAKVWLASSLPTTVTTATTLQLVDVPATEIGKENIEIMLPEGYDVPAAGVYVGYSFAITAATTTDDKYPVLTADTDMPNALFLRTSTKAPSWQDLNGNGFGGLRMEVLLQGTFADNTATAADFGPVYAELGGTATAKIEVTNAGSTAVGNIDYTITTDGVTSAEQHAVATSPIAFNKKGMIEISVPADAMVGAKAKTLNITKVNGNANAAADVAANFTLYTLSEIVARNVVVEEYTGTGCGYCPRGLVGMEKMRQTYGDRFVGIGLHQYNNSDAMYIATNAYAKLSFSGAPSCMLDRKGEIDPYYGENYDILEDFAAEMAIPALAKVSVSGTVDEGLTKVDAKAEVEAIFDNSQYTLEFVVIGDGLTGTGSAWNQANYYYQASASQVPEDMRIFANGGTYGQSSVAGWVFNDVALCSSYVGGSNKAPSLGTLSAGEKKTAEYSLTLPTKAALKNALQSDKLYVIALVVDKDKTIVNAAKKKIEIADPSGIEAVTATAEGVKHYSIDGRKLSAPQRGINIVKMSDGSTRKIFIK